MKTKLEMAHEYLIKLIEVDPDESTKGELVSVAWDYADLMQVEAKKRNNEKVLEKRKDIREALNKVDTFWKKEGRSLDDTIRFIESYKLVESCGGLDKAKEKVKVNAVWCNDGSVFLSTLKQAIADVESCQ